MAEQRFTEDDLKNKGFESDGKGGFRPIKHIGNGINNKFIVEGKKTLEKANKDALTNLLNSGPAKRNGLLDQAEAGTLPDAEAMTVLRKEFKNITGVTSYYWPGNGTVEKTLVLCLMGIPMPKQSVRSFLKKKPTITKAGNENWIGQLQPEETRERKKDYQCQIRKQLPKDWVPFQHLVMVEKMHVIFPPKKSWKKSEYPFMNTTEAMAAINAGKLILKTTRPDLPDNLKKLVNDSMSELVFKDDSIIAGEDNIRKYYGTGGMIIIELKGI